MHLKALLDIPHYERHIFKRHFLNSVHCELGFGIELERLMSAREPLAGKLQQIGFRYVRDLQQGRVIFQAPDGGGSQPSLQNANVVTGLSFSNDNPHRLLNISTSGLVMSDMAYAGFEDFKNRLQALISAVCECVGDVSVTKIGLRKLNAIRIDSAADPAEAVAAFGGQLFGLARSRAISPKSFKASHELLALERDGSVCNLRTTLASTGTPNSYDVQLDFDVQRKDTTSASLDSELATMNAFIYDIFRWAITEEFIPVLES